MSKNFCLKHGLPIVVAALGLAGGAMAQTTWNLSTSACDPTGSGTSTTAGCTIDGITATVTGWSSSTTSTSSTLVRATLTDQGSSGIGIRSASEDTNSPQHAIDSSGLDELVLISFGTDKVALTGLSTGWSYNDTDISVLRWNGTTGPDLTTMSLMGTTTGLLNQGWQLVTAQDIDGSNTNNNTTFGLKSGSIPTAAGSSWWIISAYFGTSTGNLDMHNDYFKLLSFSGTKSNGGGGGGGGGGSIPEPGSLALAGLALFGAVLGRRKVKARSA